MGPEAWAAIGTLAVGVIGALTSGIVAIIKQIKDADRLSREHTRLGIEVEACKERHEECERKHYELEAQNRVQQAKIDNLQEQINIMKPIVERRRQGKPPDTLSEGE